MKIEFINRSEKASESCDWRDAVEIKINSHTVFSVSDGEPEDSNLSRDFNGVYGIPKLMQMAYDAGVRGEPFELEEYESDDI